MILESLICRSCWADYRMEYPDDAKGPAWYFIQGQTTERATCTCGALLELPV